MDDIFDLIICLESTEYRRTDSLPPPHNDNPHDSYLDAAKPLLTTIHVSCLLVASLVIVL